MKRAITRPLTRCAAALMAALVLFSLWPGTRATAASYEHADEYIAAYRLTETVRRGDGATNYFTSDRKLDLSFVLHLTRSALPYLMGLSYAEGRTAEGYTYGIKPYAIMEKEDGQAAARAAEIAGQVVKAGMSDREKAKALHDWLVNNCRYDLQYGDQDMTPYTAYGALVKGLAVCDGYASAYLLMCEAAGIPVFRVWGQASNDGIYWEEHAWNLVLVDGDWRHVDVTWDDADFGPPLYTYFFIEEDALKKDHRWNAEAMTQFMQYVSPARPDYAELLNRMGLFMGTAPGVYALDKIPTRAQGTVMMARLLGREEEALERNLPTPFTDVPSWAAAHAGLLYAEGYLQGTSADKMSADRIIPLNEYLTFVLRAMGYKDNADFVWNRATELGLKLGLVTRQQVKALETRTFSRADMVNIAYAALGAAYADRTGSLLAHLVSQGYIDEGTAALYPGYAGPAQTGRAA